jgi:two-component system, NarL family, nitrate/nitrite response regulator NarL
MTTGLLTRRNGAALTARELEILGLVSRGFESGAIGRELHLSPETVRTHVTHVLGKLGAHTRAEAVAIAVRKGLIE